MPTPSTYSFTFASTMTGVKAVDSLISGAYWLGSNWTPLGPTNLSYSFMAPNTSYFVANYSPDNEYNALYALTTAQQIAITSALSTWSSVANLNFTLTSDTISNVGDLRFGGYRLMDSQTAAWAYFPTNAPSGGDVWIGTETNDPNPVKGTYDYMTFVHEIGHALGLKHPFDVSATNKTLLDAALDDSHFTVMSYNNAYSYQPTTPMPLDILAIQSLYGANNLWQTGDNVYKWAADQSIFETIWDAGGNDTIDGSNQLAAVSINLNEGAYSQIGKTFIDLKNQTAVNDGLAIAFGAKIENAIGSAFNDTLTGNALNNVLDGRGGLDTMIGGAGSDLYILDQAGELALIQELANEGTDTLYIGYTPDAGTTVVDLNRTNLLNVENVTLDNANIGAFTVLGNALNNTLIGNSGDNLLDGGTGGDILIGGTGNDTYKVDSAYDVVVETSTLANEIDSVISSVNFALGANLENLTLTGTDNLNGNGNGQNNVLTGNAGNNVLNGMGGLDTMIGGGGSDLYILDQVGELALVQEQASEGIDTLYIAYTPGAGTTVVDLNRTNLLNVENVTLDNANTGPFTVLGNALNNTLIGNIGDNVLDGGAGGDILIGGAGNDTYIVDSAYDVVLETSTVATEIDSVFSSVNFALGANLENLTLTGTANINGNGNEQNNVLIGNAGNNVFNGMGGLDTMIGGAGSDLYILDQAGELALIQEQANEGTDTLYIGYTPGADTTVVDLNRNNLLNVENVTLDNANTGAFILLGNALNNTLNGNSGNNVLNGGVGADYMVGGAGNDTYYVDNIGDTVVETDTSLTQIDSVLSTLNYTLGNNVEALVLLGADNLNGTGNALNNYMVGNSGDNVLDGGTGGDTLVGGTGNDTYIVDNAYDVVVETSTAANEIDRVISSVNFALGANLENLTLTGSADLNGNGNELNNILIGNAGNNVLNGLGGLDTMIGGAGSDLYILDQAGELALVQEQANEGIDTLYITYTPSFGTTVVDLNLGNLQNVENVTLDNANTGPFTVLGNALNNTLIGNIGDNILNGGAGGDILIGGAGNDTYIVDNAYDVVLETSTVATEIDSVFSSVNFALGANLENLTLTGSSNINGSGNALNNTLIGNAGNNILNGGAGADTLTGGAGADTFVFRAVNEMGIGANRDVITDFNSLQGDKIDLTKFDANLPNAGFDRGFTFIGNADFTGAGQVRFFDHVLSGNVSGGTGTDFEIQLVGVNNFSANDLVA